MAGIPMYYGIPTSGEVEAEMARDKMDVLKTQEKAIELDELVKAKKIIADQASKKLAEAKMATHVAPPSTPAQVFTDTTQPPKEEPAKQVLSNIIQGEKPAITSDDGTPMPSFMTGTKTEEAQKVPGAEATVTQVPAWSTLPQDVKDKLGAAQTEDEHAQILADYQATQKPEVQGYQGEQKVEAAPAATEEKVATPYQAVRTSNQDLGKANDDVASAYKTADLFKQNGLLLQYQKQLKIAADLENVRSEAEVRHITASKGLLEVSGQIAQGYLDSIEKDPSPANREKSWGTAIMQLNRVGIPIDDLLNLDPSQRDQVAHQYADSAISGANKLKLELEYLKEKGRNDRAQASLELRQDLGEKRLRMAARNQEAIQMRFDKNMDFKERTFNENRLKTIVTQAQRDRSELNQELDDLNYKLSGIRSGTILTDRAGNKLTKESRMQEVADIQKDINRITSQRDDLSDEIKSYELKFKDLPAAAKTKEGEKPVETKTEEAPKASEVKPGAPTQGNVSDAKAAVKAIQVLPPDQRESALAKIKANWEKAHPGFKFEEYVTV